MINSGIKVSEIKHARLFLTAGFLLICLGLLFPVYTEQIWFNIIIKIRDAINTGDSGHLILGSAKANFLNAIQSTFIFMGIMLVIFHSKLRYCLTAFDKFLVSSIAVIVLHWMDSLIFKISWEPVSTIMALFIILMLFEKLFGETNSFIQVFIVSIQFFFAFNWLNIMPFFSIYLFGQSDIPYSIKITGIYLNAAAVLNFSGFAFFLPFIISAFITATLFMISSKNIRIMRENYEKESEIRNMRAKALENRVYKEVKSLVHDLKTPLVTIRGLNSLILSKSSNVKLKEYSERIESSVTKMSEMISSFLYEDSRQRLKTEELISYIRAQLPLEDEEIRFKISVDDELSDVYINKILIARAVINILENAIFVPCKHPYKIINMDVKQAEEGINIMIQDNGIGIKESELDRVWEIGYSTNDTSGLGLPFAKSIFEDNGGRIEIHSQVDIGTTVAIFLPSFEFYEKSLYKPMNI